MLLLSIFFHSAMAISPTTNWNPADWNSQGFTNVTAEVLNFDSQYSASLEMSVVIDNSSKLATIDLSARLEKLNEIYSQCEIGISKMTIYRTDSFQGITKWDQFSRDSDNALEVLRNAVPISSEKVVLFYLPGSSVGDYSGFSFADWDNRLVLRPDLFNTLWIFDYSLSPEYHQQNPDRYDLLAHELLHVLTKEGQHIAPSYHSLLSISRARTNRILPENCELARKFFE